VVCTNQRNAALWASRQPAVQHLTNPENLSKQPRPPLSDTLRPIEQSNPTSPYILIDSLVGRTEKVPEFINRDGMEDFISPHTINEIFIDGVVRFQMRLVSKTSFQFMICLDSKLNASQRAAAIAATEHRLRELLDQKRMSNVTFAVVAVDDLPVDPKTRKFRLIADAQP